MGILEQWKLDKKVVWQSMYILD